MDFLCVRIFFLEQIGEIEKDEKTMFVRINEQCEVKE